MMSPDDRGCPSSRSRERVLATAPSRERVLATALSPSRERVRPLALAPLLIAVACMQVLTTAPPLSDL